MLCVSVDTLKLWRRDCEFDDGFDDGFDDRGLLIVCRHLCNVFDNGKW